MQAKVTNIIANTKNMSSKKTINNKIQLVILTGSVGVGKSSTADAISKILSSKKISNVVY